MENPLMTAIIGGISGAISSAICYYFLEKRKEHIFLMKNRQTRVDAIVFLKSLKQYCGKDNKYLEVLNNLGNYRIFNMSPILEKAGIARFEKDINGNYISLFSKGFYDYSKTELKVIIKDIKNCKFE